MDGETIVAIIFGAALAVFSLVMVCYSFFRGRWYDGPAHESAFATLQSTTSQTQGEGPSIDSIYESIYTLELEHQLGNLPEQQFQEQFQAYRLQAATTLKEQIENGQGGPLWLLEGEIMEARSVIQGKLPVAPFCQDCSAPVPTESRTCLHCGADLFLQRAADHANPPADESR